MVPLFVLLLVGVLAYSWWKWRFTSLTSMCRWREDRAAGEWQCAACGARTKSNGQPKVCLRNP